MRLMAHFLPAIAAYWLIFSENAGSKW